MSLNLASREAAAASVGYDIFPGPPCGAATGQLDQAQGWLHQAADRLQRDRINSIVPGQIAWLRGDCAEALRLWTGQAEQAGRSPFATFLAARGLYASGNINEAISYFRQIDPTNAIYERATNLLNAGEIEQATRLYELAFAIRPSVQEATQLAQRYRESQQIDRAVATWQLVMDNTTSDQADHWQARAEIADLLGKQPEAQSDLERAIELATDPYLLYLRLGRILVQREAWQEALAVYKKAIELYPRSSSEPYSQAGLVSSKLGDYAAAMNWFDQSLAVLPNDPWPNIHAGSTALQFGDLQEAENRYRAALRQSPDHVGAMWAMGLFLQQQQRYREALEYLEPIADALDCSTLALLQADLANLNLSERAAAVQARLDQRCRN